MPWSGERTSTSRPTRWSARSIPTACTDHRRGAGRRRGDHRDTATLQEPEHGLTEARLAETDVLMWWGHAAHGKVEDEIVERVQRRVWRAWD